MRGAFFDLFNTIKLSEQKKLIILSVIVGVISGVSAFLFKHLIDEVYHLCCTLPLSNPFFSIHWYRPLLTATGGLLAGLIIFYFAREAKGHGVTEVIYALRRRGGVIRPRVALVKSIASALTIGTGGSAGPEGPIIQIGATVGSALGQWLHLSPRYLKTLVAAGAAGGIAAVFNAPIAAVIFAMEVLLRDFSRGFSMVVLASVTGSITSHLLLGDNVFLPTRAFGIEHPAELGLYFLLGILAAPIAKGFIKSLLFFEEFFEGLKCVPEPAKPMIGGLLVGTVGLFIPKILGAGYAETTLVLLTGSDTFLWSFSLLGLLIIGKALATSVTLGSGGSGGLLMPSLFIGAMTGNLFGNVARFFFPTIASSGAYALAGMGLIFACVAQAPFTVIVMMFEITHDYRIVIPLMFAVTVAMLMSRRIGAIGLDAHVLLKRGIQLEKESHHDPLMDILVGEVMVTEVDVVRPEMTIEEFTQFTGENPHTGFPVANAEGEVLGLVTYIEIHRALSSGAGSKELSVEKIMRKDLAFLSPHENLADAMEKMQKFHVDRLPVVEEGSTHLVGLITRSNMMASYQIALKRF